MESKQKSEPILPSDDNSPRQQGIRQDNLRALQEGIPDANPAVQPRMQPRYPNWPTSRPGPLVAQPGFGQQPINAFRPEQMVEVGYNQATGEPKAQNPERYWPDEDLKGRTGFDQLDTAQEVARKDREKGR